MEDLSFKIWLYKPEMMVVFTRAKHMLTCHSRWGKSQTCMGNGMGITLDLKAPILLTGGPHAIIFYVVGFGKDAC
jgi:hypothetical protein